MGLFKWAEKRVRTWHWYDFSLLKWCVFALALWLAIVWPPILSLNVWVYATVWIVTMAYLLWKLFR